MVSYKHWFLPYRTHTIPGYHFSLFNSPVYMCIGALLSVNYVRSTRFTIYQIPCKVTSYK